MSKTKYIFSLEKVRFYFAILLHEMIYIFTFVNNKFTF